MPRRHALTLAILIGLAAVFGVLAASRTVSLGNASRAAGDATVLQRSRALDRYEASLRKVLAAAARPVPRPSGTPASQPVKIVYHRPPPVVVTVHRRGESEGHDGGELDD